MSRNKREGVYIGKTSRLDMFYKTKHVRNKAQINVYGHELTNVASVNATIIHAYRCHR